jgi:hypothetical protein
MMGNLSAVTCSTNLKYEIYWQIIGWILVMIILWLSLTPKPVQLPDIFGWDKGQHMMAYGTLMYWFGMCHVRHWRWPLFLACLGIGLEFVQGWSGLRSFDAYDMLANFIGVVIGLFVIDTPMGSWLSVVDRFLASQFSST